MLLLHRYVGLVLAPLLVVIGLTGSISVFRVELDRMINPDFFVTAHESAALPLGRIVETIRSRHPGQTLIAVDYRPAPHGTIHAYLSPATDKAGRTLPDEFFLDPSDAKELGSRVAEGCCLARRVLIPFIYRVHYSLAAGPTGLWIVGITALVWSLDCLNGILLTLPPVTPPWRRGFWPGWKKAWLIARPRSASRLFFDIHRAFGLWLWILLLGMAVSGVALSLGPQIFQPVVRTFFPMAAPVPPVPSPNGAHRLSLDEAESRAYGFVVAHGVTARPAALLLGTAPESAMFYLFSDDDSFPAGFGSPMITVDRETGAIIQSEFPPHGRLGDMILQFQDPFHSGRLAGLAGRILVCFSGVVTSLLSITGILIWQRKRRARLEAARKVMSRQAPDPDRAPPNHTPCAQPNKPGRV
ncbi:putative iron-regulated membrane protein [Asaia krungthepensis NRIC 0535]|uniref:Iron-regulated membrane protein n=2 Tax=Asaia krungthepensis TaxID=220990 RepID=A0ABQ0Q172_9PROT|nr:putative iron-regulated membrane protein [Asaia krungthepensis NRIC 0535]